MQKANSLAAADRSRDLLEALTAIPAAHIADDRPVFDFPGATAEAKNGHGTWTTRASGDIATASSPSAAASASLNDHAVPPRPFATLDDDQLADGLAMTRLALQPASQAPPPPPPPPSEESDEESIPPIPADGEPAVPSTPTDAADAKDTIAGAKKLGEEPVDDRLQFLRAEAVLLEPGEWQWDVGLVYAFQHDDVPIVTVDGLGNVTDVVEGQVRSRDLFVPFGVRYGYSHNTQLFLNAPVGWSNSELSLNGFDEVDNDGGIGDITFGSTFLLTSNECRDVMFTFAATAPTGGDPFDVNLAFPAASLGDGFWALSGDLICTRTYDPLVVFTTIGSRHYFERSHSGSDILPGSEWRWSMGVGLAVSSKVTLSARFAAAFIEETKVDGDRIPGTIQEPMSIRLAATIAQCHRWFEPFVDFGTNDDANATVFGAIYTY